jgi:predicted MFS family arabinose efflux permease
LARVDFHRVLGAEVVSNFGSMLSRLAIPWFATLALDASPLEMGLLLVADVLAAAIGSLALGVAVDRMGKRATMLAADFARAGLLALLAWLAYTQRLSLWMLVIAAGASGLLTVMFELARSAWMAQRVDAADLLKSNAQISAGGSLSETLAFALGGWLYQGLGAALALLVDAASYLISALFLKGVKEAPSAPSARRGAWMRAVIDDTKDGIAALVAAPTMRVIAVIEVIVALGASLAATSYMIFVARDLAIEPGILGLIFATGGIGSLLGAALAPGSGRRFGSGRAMAAGLALLAVGAFCIPLAPGATVLGAALLVAHQIIGDGGHAAFDVHDRTLRQTAVPLDQLARVDAGIRTLGQVATLAGAVGGGVLATAIGARSALVLSAALFALAAIFAYANLGRFRA